MANKAISELTAASQVSPSDLFVLQQGGMAKKLTGQILENWLLSFADGHGGIQSITKTSTSGLVDTYTIAYSDQTTSTFTVHNGEVGKGVTSVALISSVENIKTYRMTFSDNTYFDYNVADGEVSLSLLEETVQDIYEDVDAKYEKPDTGIPYSDLNPNIVATDEEVQAIIDGEESIG